MKALHGWKQTMILILIACIVNMSLNRLTDVQAAKMEAIKLDKTQYVLKKGEKVKLKATIKPKSVMSKIVWKSSKPKVISVTEKGVAKARVKKGNAVITAKSGKKKAVCKITIGIPVKKISASNINLKVGEKKKITTILIPQSATIKTLKFTSNNKAIVKADKKGNVMGIKEGKAIITIMAKDRMKVKKKILVKVKKKTVQVSTTKKNTNEQLDIEWNSKLIERVRAEIISHYTKLWKPDGTYTSFSSEDMDIRGKMVFSLRYAMSDKKAQEIIANGGVPNANTFVTMIYVDKSTGKVYDDERYGDTWFIKLQ